MSDSDRVNEIQTAMVEAIKRLQGAVEGALLMQSAVAKLAALMQEFQQRVVQRN